MTKTTESVLFLFSPTTQACYSLSSAPTTDINKKNKRLESDNSRYLINFNYLTIIKPKKTRGLKLNNIKK